MRLFSEAYTAFDIYKNIKEVLLMKKKLMSLMLASMMLVSVFAGCSGGNDSSSKTEKSEAGTASAASEASKEESKVDEVSTEETAEGGDGDFYKEDADLTPYSIMTTNANFGKWLADAEEKTGLKISVIAAPTNSDTRQQKITTVLSSGDSSIDIIEINDEMAGAFKNTGWLEPPQDTVMTGEVVSQRAEGYIADVITSKSGAILGVQG